MNNIFGVLAGSTITNTGPTTVSGTAGGNIGLHPGDDPTMGTFPGQVDVTLSGTVHLFDAVAEQAKVDLVTAYNDAAGRVSDETISADLGGTTFDVCLSPGSLRVTKEVQGSVNDMTLPDFEITVAGPNEFSDTQTIEAGDSYTWEGLVYATYTVSEGELSEEWNASGTTTSTTGSTPSTPEAIIGSPVVELPEDTLGITPIDTQVVVSPELDITADVPPVLPQTGDNSRVAFYLGGLFLIAGGLITRKKIYA